MDEDNKPPSEINSFRTIGVIKIIKKRKLQTELLDLPTAKHTCRESSPSNESVSMCIENSDVQSISEQDSGKDSNSFWGDSDSPTSVYGDNKVESEHMKAYLYNRPSTSSGSRSSKDASYPLDNFKLENAGSDKEELTFLEHDGGIQVLRNHEEHLLQFGNHVDYINCEYEDIEQCTDKELEDLLYSNELNSNTTYVLSSGRWSVHQETQSSSRKPTIDQEFEQYFSMLML